MPRFVILRHETPPDYPRPLHWDFMLEADGKLTTWALPAEPELGAVVIADVLDDHRVEYLDYEGPLSDNRGDVTRWDEGNYENLPEDDCGRAIRRHGRVIRLHGRRLNCSVTIRTLDDRPGKVELRFGDQASSGLTP